MKTIFIMLFLLGLISRATAQQKPRMQNAALNLSSYAPKAVFSYRGGFITHHDTVLYLRDTLVRKRTYNIVQMPNGELRQVPAGSIKPIAAQDNTAVYGRVNP